MLWLVLRECIQLGFSFREARGKNQHHRYFFPYSAGAVLTTGAPVPLIARSIGGFPQFSVTPTLHLEQRHPNAHLSFRVTDHEEAQHVDSEKLIIRGGLGDELFAAASQFLPKSSEANPGQPSTPPRLHAEFSILTPPNHPWPLEARQSPLPAPPKRARTADQAAASAAETSKQRFLILEAGEGVSLRSVAANMGTSSASRPASKAATASPSDVIRATGAQSSGQLRNLLTSAGASHGRLKTGLTPDRLKIFESSNKYKLTVLRQRLTVTMSYAKQKRDDAAWRKDTTKAAEGQLKYDTDAATRVGVKERRKGMPMALAEQLAEAAFATSRMKSSSDDNTGASNRLPRKRPAGPARRTDARDWSQSAWATEKDRDELKTARTVKEREKISSRIRWRKTTCPK